MTPSNPARAGHGSAHRARWASLSLAAVGVAALGSCDNHDGRQLPPARPDQTASVLTTTIAPETTVRVVEAESAELATLPATTFGIRAPWTDDGQIPAEHTCQGQAIHDQSPAVAWGPPPAGTVELAVVFTDSTDGVLLWVMSGIDPALGSFPAGVVPAGAVRAVNDTGIAGYRGPCPASGTHTYLLELFAIGQQLELGEGTPARDATTAIEAAAIDVASVSGLVTA